MLEKCISLNLEKKHKYFFFFFLKIILAHLSGRSFVHNNVHDSTFFPHYENFQFSFFFFFVSVFILGNKAD